MNLELNAIFRLKHGYMTQYVLADGFISMTGTCRQEILNKYYCLLFILLYTLMEKLIPLFI